MIDPNSNIPMYIQLEKIIKEKIVTDTYKNGEKLPSEKELSKMNKVSLITVRKALFNLESEGLIERIQGKGTFVASEKYQRNLNKFISFSEMCEIINAKAGTKVIENKVLNSNDSVSEKLKIPSGRQVIYIERVRYVNEKPMIIEKNYFTLDYAYLLNEDLSNSLFETISKYRKFEIVNSSREIEIVRSNKTESKYLEIPTGSPIIKMSSTAYLPNNEIAYVGSQLINGERFKLII